MYVCSYIELLSMNQVSKDLIAASATPLILSILQQGKSYGYEIINRIKELSDDAIQWKEGSLYPVLKKMEQKGLIKSQWEIAENGRKRKYYSIKKAGKTALANEQQQWHLITSIFNQLWKGEMNLT